mgnify:CR=1 FL=1
MAPKQSNQPTKTKYDAIVIGGGHNGLVAAAYLDYLRTLLGERGYGDAKWMLVAYNWGPDKLLAHLNAGQAWEQLAEPRRRYADRVLELAGNIPTQ